MVESTKEPKETLESALSRFSVTFSALVDGDHSSAIIEAFISACGVISSAQSSSTAEIGISTSIDSKIKSGPKPSYTPPRE